MKIGDSTFRIAAILVREPDRMSSGMGLGPRVMMTQSALEKSGLLQQGSRSGERFLFKLSPKSGNIATVRARLEQVLPDAQVTDFRESNPALTDGLKRSTGLLSLICLVAMVLGAIGVAMAMRAHLQQRVEVLAIMKSIGARSSDILRIYLFQTVLLGLVGGLIGVVSGPGSGVDFPQPCWGGSYPYAWIFSFPGIPRWRDWPPAFSPPSSSACRRCCRFVPSAQIWSCAEWWRSPACSAVGGRACARARRNGSLPSSSCWGWAPSPLPFPIRW